MANKWRRWVPGPKHGLARSFAVHGSPRPGPEQLDDRLRQCDQLRAWVRTRGFDLEDTPEDLRLLDQTLGEAMKEANSELGGPLHIASLGTEAGLFLGTVILLTVPAARWRLWPNGHPVIRLPSRRDLDVVALANDRPTTGTPLLADIYATATSPPGTA